MQIFVLSQAGDPNYGACSESTMGGVTADGSNHIFSPSNYDAAGNTLNDGVYSYTWDGESQLKTANGVTNVTYSYDGDGRRAAKVGSKYYWYGSGGEILAETDTSGNLLNEYVFFGGKRVAIVPVSGPRYYYVEDMLGSSRFMAKPSAICYDADFPPYGEERSYSTPATCAQNYKFEGKERDTETQNDDFGAREYSWRFGRWLSSDWSSVPVPVPYANLTNPQTLNLYSMVSDDPESFADLDGHLVNATPDQPGNPNGGCSGFLSCLSNAVLSDNLAGAFRQDATTTSGEIGAAVGDAITTVQGTYETLAGAGEALLTAPAATTGVGALVPAVGVAEAIHGTVTAGEGFGHLLNGVIKQSEANSSSTSEKPSLSDHKAALKQVHEKVGKQPKGQPGKFGSPQRGTPKKGYRLDPGHPNSPKPTERGPHINYWDYTQGKRGSGGTSGAVPIPPEE